MDPRARELLRTGLLRVLDEQDSRYGLSEPVLAELVRRYGFTPTVETVARELDYCADKGLAATVQRVISPENRYWRITAAGRDLIAAL